MVEGKFLGFHCTVCGALEGCCSCWERCTDCAHYYADHWQHGTQCEFCECDQYDGSQLPDGDGPGSKLGGAV